jgi:hypothetical protein
LPRFGKLIAESWERLTRRAGQAEAGIKTIACVGFDFTVGRGGEIIARPVVCEELSSVAEKYAKVRSSAASDQGETVAPSRCDLATGGASPMPISGRLANERSEGALIGCWCRH